MTLEDYSNVWYDISPDDVMTIKVDLKKRIGRTKSGNGASIASTKGLIRLVQNGSIRPEYMTINVSVSDPEPISETQRLLEIALNEPNIDTKTKQILEFVKQACQGYPAMLRRWIRGELDNE